MNFNNLKKINLLFIFVISLLALIGTAALYSAGDANFEPWAKKHIFRFIIFLFFLVIISLLNLKIIYKFSYMFFGFSLFLLILVEILGTFGKGAERWIYIFGISIQPSEIIKVAIVLAVSKYYHQLRFEKIGKIHNLFLPMIIIFLPFILTAIQPDLGTSITILLLGIFLMFFAGVKMWKFYFGIGLSIFSLPFLFKFIQPYQKNRILSFLNPELDPLGQGYQLIQSKIALGSGALTGKGFLSGTQSYLEYLPEKQTDFIFTIIGEEFGFLGVIFIIFLYLILILVAYYISIKSTHIFGRLLSLGIATNLFLYLILNISMVAGLMPIVGIPLPLLSYGGTAMLSVMISFGLLLNIELNSNIQKLS